MLEASLTIQLLGHFRLEEQGVTVTGLRSRSQELLAYLLLHRQAPQLRRRLAGQLWPETNESQGRTNLRKELHHLRRLFPTVDQLITVTPQTLHWQPQIPVELDLVTFESGSTATDDLERLETALNYYQGDLWPDCDADWIEAERLRLKQQYEGAIAQLTQHWQARGETDKAIAWGQRWLQAQPLEERVYQILMTLYGERGDRATALRLYHQCMTTLQDELGVNPSPATAEIYQQLLMAENEVATALVPSPVSQGATVIPGPLAATVPALPLVGRDTLLNGLKRWLHSAQDSTAPLLLLTGEPGIGKTRLLEALAETAADQGWQVLWGRAFAAEQLRSYGVWIDLLRTAPPVKAAPSETEPNQPWTQTLSQLLSGAADPAQRDAVSESRSQLLDGIMQGLAAATEPEQPLLLLFDDIHWLDDASTTLLHYVFRLLGQGPLRIACAVRWQELQDNPAVLALVQGLRRAQRLQEVAVPPLSAEAIAQLIRPLQNPSADAFTGDSLYADSGGNPLFALEAARSQTQGIGDLLGLIEDRLSRLDQASQDLLPWAAALGQRFNPEILATAASYPPMQLLTAMEQLEQQQIIRPVPYPHRLNDPADQGHYDFVHDLVRQVAYGALSSPRRRLIHGQLAKALDAQTQDDDLASEVAYHAGWAGNHGLAAQASAAAAARSLRLFAYRDVLQLVAQGLDHCQFLPSRDRIRLSAELLRTRVFAGVSAVDAVAVTEQLQTLLNEIPGLDLTEAELVARQALGFLNYEQGNLTDVHEQCLKSLAIIPPSPRLQAETLAANGCCLVDIERDMDQAEVYLLEAQSLAQRLGLSFSDIPSGLGGVSRYRGDYETARQQYQQALQLAQNQQEPLRQGYNLASLVMVGWDSHRPNLADAEALYQLAPQLPQGSEAAFASALIALQQYDQTCTDQTQAEQAEAALKDLDQALKQLQRLDAQRKIVFVTSHACEVALPYSGNLALTYAIAAHKAAQVTGHPNDGAIATALHVLSELSLGNIAAAQAQQKTLETFREEGLSDRAHTLLEKALQAILVSAD